MNPLLLEMHSESARSSVIYFLPGIALLFEDGCLSYITFFSCCFLTPDDCFTMQVTMQN